MADDKIHGRFSFVPDAGVTDEDAKRIVSEALSKLGSDISVYAGGSDDQPPTSPPH